MSLNIMQKFTQQKLSNFLSANIFSKDTIRGASKKSGSSTKNRGNANWKRKGILVNDGRFVQKGTLLVIQNYFMFHPGLNVGMGRNGTLYALRPGVVRVSCERPDLNMNRRWVQKEYGGRPDLTNLMKKYFNVITEEQHNRFKLIDRV
ncbi:50S ribosomal protein L27 [Macrosteles quadrilineatus]|uniref:50S ribosomal protein L27 n=1 Tax=Macrosteles quadrilineatus TaxID=74068 RepID=UPI0023E0C8E5|nr:50S ribosomal protein L27 [Macrosteles quadrilineatus]